MKITPVQLAKRVEKWAQMLAPLGVAHWEFELSLCDQIPDGSHEQVAGVQCSKDYDKCWWYFRDSFIDRCDEDELDQTIVHEWLHVAFRDLTEVHTRVEKWMPPATHDDFSDSLSHEMEGMVERIANAMMALHSGDGPRFRP